MATAHSFDAAQSRPQQARTERLVIVGADRSRMFRKARRHTLLVKGLRVVLPLCILSSVGVYLAQALSSADFSASSAIEAVTRILPENLTMQNPHYSGFTDDGGTFKVRAATANQDLSKPKLIKLNGISGELTDAKETVTRLKATRGTFHTTEKHLALFDGIDITSDDGLAARLQEASVDIAGRVIVSNKPSVIAMPNAEVRSNRLEARLNEKIFNFRDQVKTTLVPQGDELQGRQDRQGREGEAAEESAGFLSAASNEPVVIDSDTLDIDRSRQDATFSGQVRASQGDQLLESDRLDVLFEAEPGAEAQSARAAMAGGASKIKSITSPGPVVLTRGAGERLTSRRAVFDVANDKALFDGEVRMSAGPQRSAVSRRAEISGGGTVILLTGDVTVRQGPNELRGGRLFVDRGRGLSRLTRPGPSGKAGRIFARLQRNERSSGSADGPTDGWAARATQAAKTGGALSTTSFKGDPDAPTDITSVSLDVNDNSKQAVFKGKVEVRQGKIEMQTERLVATYSGAASLVDATGPGADANAGTAEGGAQLKRIRAEGKVFIVSRVDGQTASGDWADIDLITNRIELGGDVALNQGKTIISANSLKIDMKTGNAIIERTEQAPDAGWSSTLTAGQGRNQKTTPLDRRSSGRRPSMVFYPSQLGNPKTEKNKQATPPKPQARPAAGDDAARARSQQDGRPAASSWSTTFGD